MNRLEEQLRNIHLAPTQQRFILQHGFLSETGLLSFSDTTGIERRAAMQLAQNVLDGMPLYQVFITHDEEGPRPVEKRLLSKLDMGGYVFTDSFAVETMMFTMLFGMAIRTFTSNNEKHICTGPDGAVKFNLTILRAQFEYIKNVLMTDCTDNKIEDRLAQVSSFIKAILLIRGKADIPVSEIGDYLGAQQVLSHFIPKRLAWKDYKGSMITKLPFYGELCHIDLIAELSDITIDAPPPVKFLYRNIDGYVIMLKDMIEVPEAGVGTFDTDTIFNSHHDQVLLTAALLDITTNEQEIEFLNTFKFYYKG